MCEMDEDFQRSPLTVVQPNLFVRAISSEYFRDFVSADNNIEKLEQTTKPKADSQQSLASELYVLGNLSSVFALVNLDSSGFKAPCFTSNRFPVSELQAQDSFDSLQ
jgi:hypothetical protein